jgi:hypothetical protein
MGGYRRDGRHSAAGHYVNCLTGRGTAHPTRRKTSRRDKFR